MNGTQTTPTAISTHALHFDGIVITFEVHSDHVLVTNNLNPDEVKRCTIEEARQTWRGLSVNNGGEFSPVTN